MRVLCVLVITAVWLCMAVTSVIAGNPSRMILSAPAEIPQGDIGEVRISGVGLAAVEGRFGKEVIRFFPTPEGHYEGFLGVDVEAKPGPGKLRLMATLQNGSRSETEIAFKIKAKAFKQESFSVAAEYDRFTSEVLERIHWEREQFSRVYAASAPQRLWLGRFVAPVSSEITSPFGYRRIINGTRRSPHSGTDLKAAMGTAVVASNRGRVVLVGDFFFSGKSVVLDHGGGLFTMYFHLSELKVEEGSEVQKGDVIALSGMTGRVTGPHLHWGARLSGARIHPFELVHKLGGHARQGGPSNVAGEKWER